MSEVITAIYERGVLRPLQEIHLKPHQKVKIILEPNIRWRREFKNLLDKIHSRTANFTSQEIERDITLASYQIRNIKNAAKNPH